MNRLKGILESSGIFSNLVVLLAIICFFVLVLSPITVLLTVANPLSVNSMKLSQLILSTGVFILPPFVLAYLCSKNPINYLQLNKRTGGSDLIFVILFMLVIIPFVNLLGDINQHVVLPTIFAGVESWMKSSEDAAGKLVEKMLQVHGVYALLFNVFLIALLPALGEELFFRGALLRVIEPWKGMKTAIWITAFLFSAIHLQFYGFVPRLLMGAFFGYLLLWSGNLWLPIVAHFINNVIAVVFFYLKFNGYKMPDIDSIGFGNTLWIGIVSGAIGVFGIYKLKEKFQLKPDKRSNS